MPIFEFRCQRCSHEFESLVLRDGEQILCPRCGSSEVDKLFSQFGFSKNEASSCSTCSASSCNGCK